jgi:hypothetical protein
MKNDILEIFYQDYDGEMVLSGISNFKDEKDFLNQAQQYINATITYHVPLVESDVKVITVIVNDEGEWSSDLTAFEGKELTVYIVDLDWENAET